MGRPGAEGRAWGLVSCRGLEQQGGAPASLASPPERSLHQAGLEPQLSEFSPSFSKVS